MNREKVILLRVRIPQHIMKKLKVYAAENEMTMQEVIRQLIEAL
jgi:hypothetical protein